MGKVLLVLIVALRAIPSAYAAHVDEIVTKSNHAAYYQDGDGSARVSMTIKDSLERTRMRQFTILRKDNPGPNQSDD